MQLRPLEEHEITYGTAASRTALVSTPSLLGFAGGMDDLLERLRRDASAIRDAVRRRGAVLFRGFPVADAWDFQHALRALGYDLYKTNAGGASPRAKVTDETFVSTEVPAPFILGFHTEFAYQWVRPGMISFYCARPPAGYGETPLFDCASVLERLSDGLREKLETRGICYRRHFAGKRALLNFRKSWQETFGTRERDVVEEFLEDEGTDYRWDAGGNLRTSIRVPAVLTHPITGRKHLNVVVMNGDSFAYNFRHFRDRYHAATRRALEWFVRRESARDDCFMHVSFGDGAPIERSESEEIQKAAWERAIVYRWQPRDFVVLDNVRFAHGRLNVKKPRAIVAAMADAFDVRDYLRRAEETTVRPVAS